MPDEELHHALSWFALAVKPRFEKAVARTLQSKGYETLLPLYRKRYAAGARITDSELPLFPGYVCCRFELSKRVKILTAPGVIQIFGAGNIPAPLANVELASLRTAIGAGLTLQPFPYVQTGQRVRIEQGALAGVEGIVMSLKQTLRLVLSITLLERSALLEVARDEVTLSGCAGAVPCQFAGGGAQ
jgi:transcription termination/antitermination protein NusG